MNTSTSVFSPTSGQPGQQPMAGYGASSGSSFPPNPYTPTPPQGPPPQPHPNPLVNEILGALQYAPTAMEVVNADPSIAREKLEHLKRIMVDDPETMTNIQALAKKLFAGS